MSTEQRGGAEVIAKRAKASDDDAGDGGEDRLSALPDDILVLILLHLGIKEAGKTSVLSRRWRRVWTLLPELCFCFPHDGHSHCIISVLSGSEVPLRRLLVWDPDASAQSLAAWLPAAARRVSGVLLLIHFAERRPTEDDDDEEEEEEAEASQRGTFHLPCFQKATSISIDLDRIALSLPPAGVFAQLTSLELKGVWFHGPANLGDVVSSPRCPCLQKLTVRNVRGLDSITIDSKCLQKLELKNVYSLRQVTIVAQVLEDLGVLICFIHDEDQQMVVNISAPKLTSLKWVDAYDPSSVHLGTIEHLQELTTFFCVYGQQGFIHNRACLTLLPRIRAIEYLVLSLSYLPGIDNLEYLMEDMTMLPDVAFLQLVVAANGHAFGACSFHVLRICPGIKRLVLVLSSVLKLKETSECSSDCICDLPTNWKTEEISLNQLQELEIEGFRASEHEVAFVKRLLNWVPLLKMMTVTFNRSITESKAKELFQMFRSFSRPGICMKFYHFQKFSKVLFAHED